MDKKNREIFSKDEFDCLFIADTTVIDDINAFRNGEKDNFNESLEKLKKEALETEILFTSEDFDIFGGISEDKTKINTLGNLKHREIGKNKFRILDITKNTSNEQYIQRIEEIINTLEELFKKTEFSFKLNTFYANENALETNNYELLFINPKNALENLKDSKKINLYNIKLNKNTKAIALTNIVYYDNTNMTLPIGMNVSEKILVDMRKMKLELKKQKLFRVNQEIDEMRVETKIICLYEYEVVE